AAHGTGRGARLYPRRCAARRCGDRNMPGATPAGAPWCAQRRSGWSLERHAALGEETTSRRGTVLGALGVGVAVARPQVGVDAERPRGVHVLPAVVEEDDRGGDRDASRLVREDVQEHLVDLAVRLTARSSPEITATVKASNQSARRTVSPKACEALDSSASRTRL